MDSDEVLYCDECGRRAVIAIDEDISEIDYDEDGDQTEEIVHGEKIAFLCRECAGRKARYVSKKSWE
jgi:hypothetical protein